MWLGKWLSFFRTRGGVQPHSLGWTALVGLWLRAVVLPMTRKQARRILGRFTWAIRPSVGCMPFLAGWWSFCVWGPNWVQNCPLNLLQSLCRCLVMALEGWNPVPLIHFSLAERGTIFLDAAFDVDRYKVGMWAKSLGGRVLHRSPWVRTRHEAELEAMVKGVRICEHIGWPAFCLVGDNESVLEQVASFRAKASLRRQNRHLRCLFYVWRRLQATVYLPWAPGDLNPADCLSRDDSEWAGNISAAERGALDHFQALTAYDSLPTPVWILGIPKGRQGSFRNLSTGSLGAA